MKEQVGKTIREYRMIRPGEKILCGLSGGADSVCLLLVLKELGAEVCACHLNHCLRGAEADADEAFCRELCRREEIPFLSARMDAAAAARERKESVETAARALRYRFFEECAERLCADKIATAHNADDNLETMLFRLIRGTGTAGLAGIPPVRGRIIRPLIRTERREIEAWLRQRGQEWRTDKTNAEDFCTRNRIRHSVIPALRAIEPGAARHAAEAAALLRQDDEALCGMAAAEGTACAAERLLDSPAAVRARMLRALFRNAGVPEGETGMVHIRAAEHLCETGRGSINLPGGFRAVLRDGTLSVLRAAEKQEETALVPEEEASFGGYRVLLTEKTEQMVKFGNLIPLSRDIITEGPPLVLRRWSSRDRLYVPGTRGERSLKRLYADRKVSMEERDSLPVLCRAGEILAAAGIGASGKWIPGGGGTVWLCYEKECGRNEA